MHSHPKPFYGGSLFHRKDSFRGFEIFINIIFFSWDPTTQMKIKAQDDGEEREEKKKFGHRMSESVSEWRIDFFFPTTAGIFRKIAYA